VADPKPLIHPSDQLRNGSVVYAPGKLNRFLHIIGRRADGYHDLETGFQFLEWADRIHVRQISKPGIHVLEDPLGLGQDNLVVQAARALPIPASVGIEILIEKQLPQGAGLGGGSSDAASTLVALNQLLGLELPRQRLVEIGLTLGADVPVFVHGRSCFATGVGEQFEDADWGGTEALIATPPIHISTATIFAHPKLTRNTPSCRIRASQLDTTSNDCEALAKQLHPEIRELTEAMSDIGQPRLTGTGASVFVIDPDHSATQSLATVHRLANVKLAALRSYSMLYTSVAD
jgi:4-diphosphocytidyl-2-C-methyl-D-erythritol kinase